MYKLRRLPTYFKNLSIYKKILLLAIFSYILIVSLLTSFKHYCFGTYAFDFGLFVQILWNTINGNFLFTQPIGSYLHPENFLGVHISPLLLYLVPLYYIFETPYTLIIIQTIVLALPAIFIYKISHNKLGEEKISLIFAIGYLLYPGTMWPNWFDFHLESFVPLFLSMMYYFYFKNEVIKFATSTILLMTTFEKSSILAVSFIIYIVLREVYLHKRYENRSEYLDKKNILILIFLLLVSISYYFISEKIMNIVWYERTLRQPAMIFGTISYNMLLIKIAFIAILAAPLFFLSFNSVLELIPATPYLLLAILTDYQPYFTITWQYPTLVSIPFFVSAIFGYDKINIKNIRIKLILSFFFFLLLLSPISPLMSKFSNNWSLYIPNSEIHLKQEIISKIEKNATILAQDNLFPHVAERKHVYTLWPTSLSPPEYILFDVLDSFNFYNKPEEKTFISSFNELNNKYSYGIFAQANGLILMKKDYNGTKESLLPLHFSLEPEKINKYFISFEDIFREVDFFIPDWVIIKNDHLLLRKGFIGNAWWGPYVLVPPGNYTVEVEFSLNEKVDGPILKLFTFRWNDKVFSEKIIFGEDLNMSKKNVVNLEFEIQKWVPDFEIVGMSYGSSDILIYSVKWSEVN